MDSIDDTASETFKRLLTKRRLPFKMTQANLLVINTVS